MNSARWTLFAIGYQCGFAYAVSLVVYQLGLLFTGKGNAVGTAAALAVVALLIFLLVRPYREPETRKAALHTEAEARRA